MIQIKDSNNTIYDIVGDLKIAQPIAGYVGALPAFDVAVGKQIGILPQSATLQVLTQTLNEVPLFDIKYISRDNGVTWQKVFFVENVQWALPPQGWHYHFIVHLYVSSARLGATHTYNSVWGHTSVAVAQNGNHTAPVKLTYNAPVFFAPLLQSIVDFAGQSIDYTAPARSYGGVSYDANQPIFDEGLYYSGQEKANFALAGVYSNYTLVLLLRYKSGAYAKTICKINGAPLYWTSATQLELYGAAAHDVAYPQTDYEAGKPVMVVITHKSDGTGQLICGVYDEANNVIVNPQSVAFTDTTLNDLQGTLYIGYDGGTDIISGHSIANIALYGYEVPNAATAEWVFTLAPLQFNDLYITNVTAGPIVYQEGMLTDAEGNSLQPYVSGNPLVAESSDTITMQAGLSGLWSVEVQDVYVP